MSHSVGQTEKSTIAQHCWSRGRQAQFAQMSVIFKSDSWQVRVTRESLEIAISRQVLYQEEGVRTSAAWQPLYEKLWGEEGGKVEEPV